MARPFARIAARGTGRARALLCVAAAVVLAATGADDGDTAGRSSPQERLVLLELFTSQGCDMCPAAERLLDRLAREEKRVVPIALHVDYFNEPWVDPFSDRQHSARQWQYSTLYDKTNKVGKADYLYFTPMLMVDGRYPMLGSDAEKAQRAIRKALAERPGVSLRLALKPGAAARQQTLDVTLLAPASSVAGKDMLVGAAITEDPVTTRVDSGENAGKTLVEHHAVRKLAVRSTRVEPSATQVVSFPLALEPGWNPDRCAVVVYVQEESTGRIQQAARLAWATPVP